MGELKPFLGEHPSVMKKRIKAKNWKFDYDNTRIKKTLKNKTPGGLDSSILTELPLL